MVIVQRQCRKIVKCQNWIKIFIIFDMLFLSSQKTNQKKNKRKKFNTYKKKKLFNSVGYVKTDIEQRTLQQKRSFFFLNVSYTGNEVRYTKLKIRRMEMLVCSSVLNILRVTNSKMNLKNFKIKVKNKRRRRRRIIQIDYCQFN